MADVFGGKPKKPTVQKVAPPPTITTESEDWALKRTARGTGWAKAADIAGDLVPPPMKKTFLG